MAIGGSLARPPAPRPHPTRTPTSYSPLHSPAAGMLPTVALIIPSEIKHLGVLGRNKYRRSGGWLVVTCSSVVPAGAADCPCRRAILERHGRAVKVLACSDDFQTGTRRYSIAHPGRAISVISVQDVLQYSSAVVHGVDSAGWTSWRESMASRSWLKGFDLFVSSLQRIIHIGGVPRHSLKLPCHPLSNCS
ncbi:hypothetical protein PCASD_02311 [Puccinia coronata f. sp. avenae]|uniref:Uncharacterized protein n=1 Tax=Puccinia coronata f. sp. avenae TaxID=200324 RepID=A0A2N5VAX6_9BASI|nr:hypothetical protein PCASD_02311 [Puccinia coronata f. sp. avenae]